jgi:hypothetical protein
MWNELIGKASDNLPRFNHYLLAEFKRDTIREIPKFLDGLFVQSIVTLENHLGVALTKDSLKYIGYKELTPDEKQEWLRKDKGAGKRRFDVEPSHLKTYRYDFSFRGELYPMYIEVPVLINHAIALSGVNYYPLFAIVEKGGLSRKKNEVVLQVLRANLKFFREDPTSFRASNNRAYRAALLTCRIHQKSRKHIPIALYHLAKFGFAKTMAMYGMTDKLFLSDNCLEEAGYVYVGVCPNVYIKIKEESLSEVTVLRMILSLLACYKVYPKFDLPSLYQSAYYAVVLGKWTDTSNVQRRELLHKNAVYHLQMNDSILDPAAIQQYQKIGIRADNIDSLLLEAFYNLDMWLSSTRYQGNDLYDKKIGALDQMMAVLVRTFNTKMFKKLINDKAGLTKDSVKSVMYAPRRHQWITGSSMFSSMPTVYNDNFLLTIGARRYRSKDNVEQADGHRTGLSIQELKAHPSQAIVESILYYPNSNPVVTGSINPYLEIDSAGNIIRPDIADEIEHCFD